MTTRSRARWAAAAAAIVLAGSALTVSTAPAAAAPVPISILSVSAESVRPGDTVRVRFRVTNTGNRGERAVVVVGGGLRCTAGCRAEPNLGAGRSKDFEAALVAPGAGAGETIGLNISVAVRLGGQNNFDFKMVYVNGSGASSPSASTPASGVDRISGRVRDGAGKAVGGATLTVRDSAGHEYRTTSDRSGKFSIRSGAATPIAEGPITVVAAMDGYRTARTTVRGSAGDTANVRVTLAAVAASASPSPTTTASPLAAVDGSPEPKVTIAVEAPPTLEPVSDEGNGSLLFIGLGGLLVAVGLGALVLMVARRRRAPDEPVPPVATRLTAPVAPGMGDAPTAVLRTVPPAQRFPAPPRDGAQHFGHDRYGGPGR